jgi:uncharacterized membrane protein YgcG
VLLLVWLAAAAVALAAPPLKLDAGLLTDDARVLGDSADGVEQALEQLESDHGVQLFVVFVETFDSYSAQDWANETA